MAGAVVGTAADFVGEGTPYTGSWAWVVAVVVAVCADDWFSTVGFDGPPDTALPPPPQAAASRASAPVKAIFGNRMLPPAVGRTRPDLTRIRPQRRFSRLENSSVEVQTGYR